MYNARTLKRKKRTNVDAHFVLSLGEKVNNNKYRVRIIYTEQKGEGVQTDRSSLRVLIFPNSRIDASTKVRLMF